MKNISVKDYANEIALEQLFSPTRLKHDTEQLVAMLWKELVPVLSVLGAPPVEHCESSKRRGWLDAALTVLAPNALSPSGIAVLDTLLDKDKQQQTLTSVSALMEQPFFTVGSTKIVLWKGDITTLQADAIVNAANHQLLGCFQPGHKCIDNAIHRRAGVQLRKDCKTIIDIQGEDEQAGQAKITRGYHLPARYVIHTVGPIVSGIVQKSHRQTLASCYRNTLDMSKQVDGIDSIALCSISTGVYGYPIEKATPVAIAEVVGWIHENPNQLKCVVFNVFSDRDHSVYQSLLEEFVCQQ
ncbi:protein-ADP-ribose hydrolase [Photobacterium satsumensis]|uniref:protein-ADP-ribose hydrolase n=1 Tax=Photobacterium satsumensis TaxID=2910239 RepID=UPI003D126E04